MAVYLRLPPDSKRRQCRLGSQSSPPLRGQRQWSHGEGGLVHSCSRCLKPGLFKSPNGSLSGAVGDSGKCSPPAALASAVP